MVAAYLAAQNLRDIEIIRGEEPPQQATGSGKYRQVIANVPH
jgi:hypothetical protein